ncbi:maleylpyruvate isomerase family mycothiol-dependent enzyme [Acrocarpospora catenulata]|uniref:maleylpyruvate isomerase family mycothiol-dependent enzyme n=1 Tax=Acrocarpospora catenulata TaxID=2836182 RepID=UPI001BD975E1|nr:maleylpyruvate isomerase family mycothiol-dependent enzyme [Acrocarpospora catenulata]
MSSRFEDGVDYSWLGDPINARELFGTESQALLELLRGLGSDEWGNLAVPGWSVHDLAVHVLGDYYGRLGGREPREGRQVRVFKAGETLEEFIHRSNQEWVDLNVDVSSATIVEDLEVAGAQVARRFQEADLQAASIGVSWAGVDPAPMWLDCAREFTEFWTHRQQIRHATGRETDLEPRALFTVLDTFMRALPHTLRDTIAPIGTQMRMVVDGPGGGTWTATATADRWSLAPVPGGSLAATVRLDAETAWRLCTRGIDPDTAIARARVHGDRRLAEAACQIVSIVY